MPILLSEKSQKSQQKTWPDVDHVDFSVKFLGYKYFDKSSFIFIWINSSQKKVLVYYQNFPLWKNGRNQWVLGISYLTKISILFHTVSS